MVYAEAYAEAYADRYEATLPFCLSDVKALYVQAMYHCSIVSQFQEQFTVLHGLAFNLNLSRFVVPKAYIRGNDG
jgi:hypothetical protein